MGSRKPYSRYKPRKRNKRAKLQKLVHERKRKDKNTATSCTNVDEETSEEIVDRLVASVDRGNGDIKEDHGSIIEVKREALYPEIDHISDTEVEHPEGIFVKKEALEPEIEHVSDIELVDPDIFVKREPLEPEIDHVSDIELVDPDIFVKEEALEPEIGMVEGSEDVLDQDASRFKEEQFETVYCDSVFNEETEGYKTQKEDSGNLQNPYLIEELTKRSESPISPINQDEKICSCKVDTFESRLDQNQVQEPNFVDLLQQNYLNNFVRGRRNSSQVPKDFACPICERRLSRRRDLKRHMEKLHPNGELSEHHKKKLQLRQNPIKHDTKRKPVSIQNGSPLVLKGLLDPPSPAVSTTHTGVLGPLATASLPTSATLPSSPASASTPSLDAAPTSITCSTLASPTTPLVSGTPPEHKDPCLDEERMKRQFLLLPLDLTHSTEQPAAASDDSQMFSANLGSVPLEKRILLKKKLRQLIQEVMTKDLNPDKIIIAYDRTSEL